MHPRATLYGDGLASLWFGAPLPRLYRAGRAASCQIRMNSPSGTSSDGRLDLAADGRGRPGTVGCRGGRVRACGGQRDTGKPRSGPAAVSPGSDQRLVMTLPRV